MFRFCLQFIQGIMYTFCTLSCFCTDCIMTSWKHFPRYWPFVQGNHQSPVNAPQKGQWRGALMFCLICARINVWVNNREADDLRRHCAHYDVIIMVPVDFAYFSYIYIAGDGTIKQFLGSNSAVLTVMDKCDVSFYERKSYLHIMQSYIFCIIKCLSNQFKGGTWIIIRAYFIVLSLTMDTIKSDFMMLYTDLGQ